MIRRVGVMLYTAEQLSGRTIREGELVFASAISGANILRDIREAITNVLGGEMRRYEFVTEFTVQRALDSLAAKAEAKGYDGVSAVRLEHQHIVAGSISVTAYGTAFHFVTENT
jgi:uncharacterized protein YbjQ (UPF0145 family)